jgi:antitoxin PrlF
MTTTTVRTTLRTKGQLTLPPEVRAALSVEVGDEVEFVVEAPGVVAIRGLKMIPADQAWFWTPEWQAGEREVDEQLARGEYVTYNSSEEFLAALEALSKELDEKALNEKAPEQ